MSANRQRDLVRPAPRAVLRRSLLSLAFALAGLLAASGTASADIPLGTAVAVLPTATGELGGQQVSIIRGSDLYEGQTITTSASGQVQIVFVDDTRMVIGPNSSLVIERYLLRDPNSFSNLTVNALGGTFRWISGSSPHDAYTVETPTGTIGFRGTIVDFTVSWITGIVNAMALEGSAVLCPYNAQCTVLTLRCSVGTIASTTNAGVVHDEGRRLGLAQTQFPYANYQLGLQLGFRANATQECTEPQEEFAGPVVQPTPPPPPAPGPPSPSSEPPPPPPTPVIVQNDPPPAPVSSSSTGVEPPPPSSSSSVPPPAACEHNNNGIGNGGECTEGPDETGNPAHNGGGNNDHPNGNNEHANNADNGDNGNNGNNNGNHGDNGNAFGHDN